MRRFITISLALIATLALSAADLIEVFPVSDKILRLTFDEGYIQNQDKTNNSTLKWPINLRLALENSSYTIASENDMNYSVGSHPVQVGSKSKTSDYVEKFAGWLNELKPDVPNKNDSINQLYIYLKLPYELRENEIYTLNVGDLSEHIKIWMFKYTMPGIRSVAVHVNPLGYLPTASEKHAYINHWMGELGPFEADLKNQAFKIYKLNNEGEVFETVFKGKIKLKKKAQSSNTDYSNPIKSAEHNFEAADVWQANFSALKDEGEFILAIKGIGSSIPFRISKDVYEAGYPIIKDAAEVNNNKPSVDFEIVSSNLKVGEQAKIKVNAKDNDGWIYTIKVYVDNHLVGRTCKLRPEVSWTLNKPGKHTLWVEVTDNGGLKTISEKRTFLVE